MATIRYIRVGFKCLTKIHVDQNSALKICIKFISCNRIKHSFKDTIVAKRDLCRSFKSDCYYTTHNIFQVNIWTRFVVAVADMYLPTHVVYNNIVIIVGLSKRGHQALRTFRKRNFNLIHHT